MHGPHKVSWAYRRNGNGKRCERCGKWFGTQAVPFERCPTAPDVTYMPKPGQVWFDPQLQHYHVITFVTGSGTIRTGEGPTVKNYWRGEDYANEPNFPYGWQLVRDSTIDPWAEPQTAPRQTRLGLLHTE